MNLAPNGKPSKLTPEQYKLVRSPEFISWFGDWINSPETASKVVDENGEPKVKWRGDNNPKNVFDYINYGGHGVYYFSDKYYAENFGDKLNSYFINSKKPFIPKHLTKKEEKEIKDLWENDAEIILKQEMAGQGYYEGSIQDLHDYLDNYYLWDKKTGWFLNKDVKMSYPDYNLSFDILFFVLKHSINFYLLERKEIIDWIKNNNYDSYISYEGNEDNIAVFNSNQIKLADGTNTMFDANNPDIRYADGGNTTQDYWAGKKSGEWFSRKLRIDQLRIGKEFLLARRNFKLQKSKVDEQQKPVWSWQHRDSVYDEKGMAIGNDWYNNITEDVLLLSDLYNEFIELREEKKKLVNSNKEELEKIGYKDWIYKDYLINKRVEWNMHDSEGVLEGLGSNEFIMAIGTKSYCKEIQNNEAKEEYEYYIEPSKTQKGLYVLREVWLGYYLKSGGNINDFTYDIGGL